MTVTNWGLSAPKPIHWLLAREIDVRRHVQAFAADMGPDRVDVVLPPTVEHMIEVRQARKTFTGRNRHLELPTVRLSLRKVHHHLTGAPGIEVKCSDADMDLIVAYARQEGARKVLAANPVKA